MLQETHDVSLLCELLNLRILEDILHSLLLHDFCHGAFLEELLRFLWILEDLFCDCDLCPIGLGYRVCALRDFTDRGFTECIGMCSNELKREGNGFCRIVLTHKDPLFFRYLFTTTLLLRFLH